jgi:hypothetical protein
MWKLLNNGKQPVKNAELLQIGSRQLTMAFNIVTTSTVDNQEPANGF